MSEGDKAINKALAEHLYVNVMGGKPGKTLDIGAKIPVLAAALGAWGCEAYAIDAEAPEPLPGVTCETLDYESGEYVTSGFRLITLIHVFEHFYNPLAMLRTLRRNIADDGRVFIRLPDHRVAGFERDLTPHHYTIHPFFHALTSILEALSQVGDCFEIESTSAMVGSGQRDIVLRPINKRPRLVCAMIVKNEERDLPRCLLSLSGVIDEFAIVDTGSTDQTITVARSLVNCQIAEYLGASEQDDSGDWKLWDFSKARNHALDIAEMCGADWVCWFDADDELTTQNAFRRAIYWPQHDVFGTWIDGGGARWIQQRMWKASKRVRFSGRCHEYPILDGLSGATIDEGLILHHADPTPGVEDSNPRNLRMLLREWNEQKTSRTAFYIANTYRDAGRTAEAVEWYKMRNTFKEDYRDELLFSHLYAARGLRSLGKHDEADDMSGAGLTLAPDWQEFRMELAFGCYQRKEYANAIATAKSIPPNAAIPFTALWREVGMYRDQPARLISWCHEHMGNVAQALAWSDVARERIGKPDVEWEHRHNRLRAQFAARDDAPAVKVAGSRPAIALHRPGAIGDILMTLNTVPALREANPGVEIHYFCHASLAKPDALGNIIIAAGCDLVLDAATLPQWRNKYARVIDLVGYPLAEGYPEKPMRKHLLDYFAAEMGVKRGDLSLSRPKRPDDVPATPYATIQTKAGWSAYKEWLPERWEAVRASLRDEGIETILLDEKEGRTLAHSIAVFANARIHIGIDSFANHLTNYIWSGIRVPGVILWGSTQPTAAGYQDNFNLYSYPTCGPCFRENPRISQMPRGVCINPPGQVYENPQHKCMSDIAVNDVLRAARRLWMVPLANQSANVSGTIFLASQ